eukprot:9002097-Pyramimonas_sp.AAC.1
MVASTSKSSFQLLFLPPPPSPPRPPTPPPSSAPPHPPRGPSEALALTTGQATCNQASSRPPHQRP